MSQITVALLFEESEQQAALVDELVASPAVAEVLLLKGAEQDYATSKLKTRWLAADSLLSGASVSKILSETKSPYLLFVLPGQAVELGYRAVERLAQVAEDSRAGLVYSDFRDQTDEAISDHPLINYKLGSLRDTFDFGSLMLIAKRAAQAALAKYGAIDEGLKWGGLYDLRLKLSIEHEILRVPEALYTRVPSDLRATGEKQFDYVDPRQRSYQIEMEEVATAHLKRIGAYLAPEFKMLEPNSQQFPVLASIIIPVRNRERTIRDAVMIALAQKTEFDFNVIVVDNHSTDGTTAILQDLARTHDRLVHLRPERHDLQIGGCWNLAINSELCGEYAVQLDSDDLYADEDTLATIMQKFDTGRYAMVIGSYTLVNFDLKEIPPGLIAHREWTRENGRNNALRINGLGAPRAFYVPLLRQIGLPNTSYGEDYSVALHISRHYEIGRIYESLYFARRWEGNSDAALPLGTANRYDAYKDYLRTLEILARKKENGR